MKPEVHKSTIFFERVAGRLVPRPSGGADELGPKASPETLSAPPALLGDEMCASLCRDTEDLLVDLCAQQDARLLPTSQATYSCKAPFEGRTICCVKGQTRRSPFRRTPTD